MSIVQAAPGKLLDVIDMYRKRIPVITAGGNEAPFIIRRSQWDRRDLGIAPLASGFSRTARRRECHCRVYSLERDPTPASRTLDPGCDSRPAD